MKTIRRAAIAATVLALVGIAVSWYALIQHAPQAGTSFCDITQTLNCDVVNRGPYSELFGIPVAAIGVIGYAIIAAMSLMIASRPVRAAFAGKILAAIVTIAFVFTLYLTALEAFVIRVYCPICLTSQALILGIAICAWMMLRSAKNTLPSYYHHHEMPEPEKEYNE